MKLLTSLFLIMLVILINQETTAHSYQQGDIRIGHIWARVTTATTAAVYAPFINIGSKADELISITSPMADKIEIYQNVDDHGIMRMNKIEHLILEPNMPMSLSPNGRHIMLFGLKSQLKEGKTFPITFEFKRTGQMHVDVVIEPAKATPQSH